MEKFPANKIEDSMGKLSLDGKRSLSGQIGSGNKNYFFKSDDNKWNFLKWRERKSEKAFIPFSENAILKCRDRARNYKFTPN